MMGRPATVTGVVLTPVAVKDPPLLNSRGVHEPYALRAILRVRTDDGLEGLSEAYGDDPTLTRLHAAAGLVAGLSPWDLNELHRRIPDPTTAAAYEVALFDLQGKQTGLRVCDLLGGAVREAVPFSAYLFYKWAGHPGQPPDRFGAALDPDGIVAQAKELVRRYGFGSLKLKGGVFPPTEEIAAVRALRAAFPDHPLRLDPNANWSVATSHRVAEELTGTLEYLEDPTAGIPGMAEVAARTTLPLATNMCVVDFPDLPPAVAAGAVRIVLADHHFWGGLRASQRLAGICETFGLGLSMHSNTHLGISLAAMTHLAAATARLTYACDTHAIWQDEEVIRPGALDLRDGVVRVPDGPGLGVSLDEDALDRLHRQYLACGIRRRDDVAAMRAVVPGWTGARPRF
jgi:glucarate dehydratase